MDKKQLVKIVKFGGLLFSVGLAAYNVYSAEKSKLDRKEVIEIGKVGTDESRG